MGNKEKKQLEKRNTGEISMEVKMDVLVGDLLSIGWKTSNTTTTDAHIHIVQTFLDILVYILWVKISTDYCL